MDRSVSLTKLGLTPWVFEYPTSISEAFDTFLFYQSAESSTLDSKLFLVSDHVELQSISFTT
ncbi:hypothetical protein M422DRAFT_28957, partial [Sphaerobolus stellatus SS14]